MLIPALRHDIQDAETIMLNKFPRSDLMRVDEK
ncbi:unnamed protein product, partial [marine sediment metagenome]